jgi:hypothetical protein
VIIVGPGQTNTAVCVGYACGVSVSENPQDRAAEGGRQLPADGESKKPYQKPTFRYERVFETMALACGKLAPTQMQCRFNRKNS